jgi:hypothetical protein
MINDRLVDFSQSDLMAHIIENLYLENLRDNQHSNGQLNLLDSETK